MTREPHPNDPVLRATYKRQLVERLAGVEIAVLERMISARDGLVAKLVHPPAVGEITDWLETARSPMLTRIDFQLEEIRRLEGTRERYYDRNGKLTREELVPPETDEERARNVQKLLEVNRIIRETAAAKVKQTSSLSTWQATEEEAQEGRLKALEYHDAMKKAG